MGRLNMYARQRIVILNNTNYKIDEIQLDLIKTGFQVSQRAIRDFLKRYKTYKTMLPSASTGRKRILTQETEIKIIRLVDEDEEITASEIIRRLQLHVSRNTVYRVIKKYGFRVKRTQYCQEISEINRIKRFGFYSLCMINHENFDDVIFTDETSIEVNVYRNNRWCKYSKVKKVAKYKHPLKVHAWAGISRRGATRICIFNGIMDSDGFQEILSEFFLPFVNERFPHGHRLMMDNDPKHTSKSTKKFMLHNRINHWKTPPQSPDTNPIEMVWAYLKWYLRVKVKPRTTFELVTGIEEFWNNKMTPQLCNKYINKLYEVIPQVVKNNGGPTQF